MGPNVINNYAMLPTLSIQSCQHLYIYVRTRQILYLPKYIYICLPAAVHHTLQSTTPTQKSKKKSCKNTTMSRSRLSNLHIETQPSEASLRGNTCCFSYGILWRLSSCCSCPGGERSRVVVDLQSFISFQAKLFMAI